MQYIAENWILCSLVKHWQKDDYLSCQVRACHLPGTKNISYTTDAIATDNRAARRQYKRYSAATHTVFSGLVSRRAIYRLLGSCESASNLDLPLGKRSAGRRVSRPLRLVDANGDQDPTGNSLASGRWGAAHGADLRRRMRPSISGIITYPYPRQK